MKRTLLWLAAAIAVVAACQKPENNGGNDNTPASSGEKTFTATLAPLTKVSLGTDGLALSWTKADKVSIYNCQRADYQRRRRRPPDHRSRKERW